MSKYPGRIVTDLAPAGYSVFFDGTGDFLTVTYPVNWSTYGSYTLEFWFYTTSIAANNYAFVSTGGTGYTNFYMYGSSGAYPGAIAVGIQGTNEIRSANSVIAANTWYHIAYTFDGTTTRIFVNGVLVASGTTAVYPNNSANLVIGNGLSNNFTLGNISNLRLVQGTALYTAAFTPPTQLLRVTNTQLLTCNSPAIIDQSSNAFTITPSGNAAVSTFTPFTAYVPYNPALGAATPGIWTVDEAMQAAATRQWNMYDPHFNLNTLLLHGNGTNGAQNNTFIDSSSNNFTITRNGNTTQGSFSPFSQTGWSTYFDGSGDSFSVSTSTVLDLNGAIDFTIEAWVYLTGYGSTSDMSLNIANKFTGAGGLGYTYGIFGGGANQGKIQFYGAAGSVSIISTNVIPLNSWNHVAIVKSGTTYTHYLNGVANGSQTTATTLTASANALVIGDYGYSDDFLGYMSNLRITKNGAVYTSGFTPPTSPLTTSVSAGTVSLLTFQSNRFVDNSSNGFTLTPSGTPSVQAFSPFYPTVAYTPQTIGGSGYFDGVNDYLRVSGTVGIANSAFTICFWFYPLSSNVAGLFDSGSGQVGVFRNFPSNVIQDQANTGASVNFGSAFQVRAWNWMCITKSGTSFTVRINGATVGTGTCSATLTETSLDIGVINSGVDGDYDGYISNFQVLNTATVVSVPTAPINTTTGRTLLLNFTNAGVVDSTAKNVLETVGNAQISTTQSKFGGSSMAFDGTNSTLLLRSSQLMNLGASDFTLEFWMYRSAATASQPLYSLNGSSQTNVLALDMGAAGGLGAYATASGGGTWSILNGQSFGTVPLTTWTHIALVRNGSTWRGYLNGVVGFTITNSSALASFDGLSIGSSGASTLWFNGFIDDLRITRFARYTAAFTPQTSQWQDQ